MPLLIISLLIIVLNAAAQTPTQAILIGTVTDDSTNVPLENVNVYLASTTLGCGTDRNGRFELANIPPGSYDVVASRLGYSTATRRISITSDTESILITLKPVSIIEHEMVVSVPDASEWKKQLRTFQEYLFGKTRNAGECRILNPEIIDFDAQDDRFTAKASAPIEIVNDALGFHIQYHMTKFLVENGSASFGSMSAKTVRTTFDGWSHYTELAPSSAKQAAAWKKNRAVAYNGSIRHFLSSLVRKRWEDEGYIITLTDRPVQTRSPMHRMRVTPKTVHAILSAPDSLSYRSLHLDGFMEVEYTRENADVGTAEVSWIELLNDSISVNPAGLVKERYALQWYGYWDLERFADALPLDYRPEK